MTPLPPAHTLPDIVEERLPRLILIDGPSGSGKTALADRLAPLGYQVLHLDSWYPGWEGLEEGSNVATQIASGAWDAYPQWDWDNNRVDHWVPVDTSKPLVLEGCGALTKEAAPHADLRVWLELDTKSARQRGLGRDGEAFAPWWDMWRAQELEHWRNNSPWDLADLRLDATSGAYGNLAP